MSKKNQDPMIACPSCGEMNRIAAPFCKSCGDRIYKGGAAPIQEEDPRKSSAKRAFRSAFNSLIFLALVAVVGLAMWPYASVEVPQGVGNGEKVSTYVQFLDQTRDEGTPVRTVSFTQRELNSFLARNTDPDAHRLLGVIVNDGASRIVVIANEPKGPFNLSTRLVMQPAEGGAARYVPTDLWVGHLPLPTAWAEPWTQALAKRFDLGLSEELWEELRISRVDRSGVVVDVLRGTP